MYAGIAMAMSSITVVLSSITLKIFTPTTYLEEKKESKKEKYEEV